MNNKKIFDKLTIITNLICLLPLSYGGFFVEQLPEELPTRFDFQGNVSGYTNKMIFIFGIPFFFLIINTFAHFMINADPKKRNQNKMMRGLSKFVAPILLNILYPATIYISLGNELGIQFIVGIILGVILIAQGNYLPKTDVNYTMGIKLPWTLQSPENWRKTHNLAGKLYVIFGFIFILSNFIPNAFIISLILFIFANLYLIYYSYNLYKKESLNQD